MSKLVVVAVVVVVAAAVVVAVVVVVVVVVVVGGHWFSALPIHYLTWSRTTSKRGLNPYLTW